MSTAAPQTASLSPLARLLDEEMTREVPAAVHTLAADIRRRHGDAVAAILFYGSCLRKGTLEGVLDFYVVVDSYQAAYSSRLLSWANTALPPNVFYVEVRHEHDTLRAKYAVLSRADFQRGAGMGSRHAIVWGRFSQPFVGVFIRDTATRALLAQTAQESVLTLLTHALAQLASSDGTVTCITEALWQTGFRTTYQSELRPERTDTIRGLYLASPERYERVTHAALALLEQRGVLRATWNGATWSLAMDSEHRRRIAASWRRRLPVTKALYAVRLLKSAFTFGDWLPYALWKLHRHTGVQLELSERQRKHPLIWGWPVLMKVLVRRNLR